MIVRLRNADDEKMKSHSYQIFPPSRWGFNPAVISDELGKYVVKKSDRDWSFFIPNRYEVDGPKDDQIHDNQTRIKIFILDGPLYARWHEVAIGAFLEKIKIFSYTVHPMP